MDLLIILTYTAICVVIFKVFKIPLNKWSVPTAVLGGIVILGAIVFTMNYNHPYAKYAKEYFVTIPIVPQISGTVATINVVPNQLVKKGDILFTLENNAQKIALNKAKAALAESKNAVLQKDQSLVTAIAKVAKLTADRDRTRTTYNRFKEGHGKAGINSPFTQQQVDNKKQFYEASQASLSAATSEEQRIRLITESKILGENTQVAQLQAIHDKALLDYQRTFVRAPVDGTPTQVTLRPGIRAAAIPLRPVMTFIPKETRKIAGLFWQNSLLRLEKGLEAEVILDAVPGHVFKGKVVKLIPAMAEGQVSASGSLLSAKMLSQHGFAVAIIELEENLDDYNLPLGVQGQAVAINHKHDPLHVSLVRKILLRMMAWLKYIYPIK
ncbi:MAG: HlyD family secretion protein [Colwellia sp.]